jgi:alkylation response protein AidB-like acyl-CoA dehydrogenase
MATLDGGRIGIAAQACGLLAASLEASIAHAKSRVVDGKPLTEQQAIQWFLADMKTSLDAARLLTWRAAWLQDQGQPFTAAAAAAKVFAAEASVRSAIKAVQVHGGAGCLSDLPVERYMRDAKICEIGEGTSEVQRIVIAARVLKDGF